MGLYELRALPQQALTAQANNFCFVPKSDNLHGPIPSSESDACSWRLKNLFYIKASFEI